MEGSFLMTPFKYRRDYYAWTHLGQTRRGFIFKHCWEDEAIILCSCLVDPSPEMNIKGNYLGLAWLQLNWFLSLTTSFARNFTRKVFCWLKDFPLWQMISIAFPFVEQMRILGPHFPKSMGWFWTFFFMSSSNLRKNYTRI